MAEFDSSDFKVEFDNAAGALQDITQYILEWEGIMVQAGVDEDWTPLGAVLSRKGIVGIDFIDDIEMTLKFDDTAATGPWALFNARGDDDRELKVTYDGATAAIHRLIIVGIVQCDPVIVNGKKTRIKVKLVNTGTAIA